MAEKILNTRIINKHADLETWKSSSLALKTGEIALARVETTKPDGHGGFYKVPTYLMKVGDGEKTFSQLEWLAAPASDVYEWAKASSKPAYGASEITRGTSNVSADLQTIETDITNLKTAVGSGGTVASMIEAAINALDVTDTAVEKQFVTAVAEADGKISVTRRALTADDIPTLEIAKINGLQAALDAKAVKTEVEQKFQELDTAITTTLPQSIADAKKAGTDAQTYAEGVNTTLTEYKTANDARVKAIEDNYTTEEEAGTIAEGKINTLVTSGQVYTNTQAIAANNAAIAALAGEGNTSTVKANADAIAKLAQDIGNVANVMNFRGVSNSETVGADISDPKAGDVIIFGEAEYVYDASGNWVKFGDASDNATAISDLQTRVGNVENDLKAGGATYQSIVAAQNAANAAQEKANANETAIGVINGESDGSIKKAVADATTELKSYADGKASAAQTAAEANAKSYTDIEVKKANDAAAAAQTAIDTHAGKQDNPHKVTAEQVGLGKVENKTVAEIKTEFTGAVATGNEGFVTGGAVYTAIDDAKKAANSYTDAEVKKVADDLDNAETDIATIKNNYARVSGDKLVYGQGESEMTIIFDCGGAE